MNILMQLPLLMAGAEAGAEGSQGFDIGTMGIMGAMVLVFYFLIMRPQSKKQKETKAMLEAVKKGDKITTIGGIRGTVDNIKDDVVTVRVDGNTKIDFLKSAISSVVSNGTDVEVKEEK